MNCHKTESFCICINLFPVVDLIPGGDSGVSGKLVLTHVGNTVIISGHMYNLTPGYHGFHVHMTGDTGDNCKAAGGHFNPDGVSSIRSFI